MNEVRYADASIRPCEAYKDHGSSPPCRTQGHHRKPQYLQKRLYGQLVDKTIWWICGTCHDSIHAWLDYLLGEAYKPPMPPPRLFKEAEAVYAWYMAEKERMGA